MATEMVASWRMPAIAFSKMKFDSNEKGATIAETQLGGVGARFLRPVDDIARHLGANRLEWQTLDWNLGANVFTAGNSKA